MWHLILFSLSTLYYLYLPRRPWQQGQQHSARTAIVWKLTGSIGPIDSPLPLFKKVEGEILQATQSGQESKFRQLKWFTKNHPRLKGPSKTCGLRSNHDIFTMTARPLPAASWQWKPRYLPMSPNRTPVPFLLETLQPSGCWQENHSHHELLSPIGKACSSWHFEWLPSNQLQALLWTWWW